METDNDALGLEMKWYPFSTRFETGRTTRAANRVATYLYSLIKDNEYSLQGSSPMLLGKLLGHTQVQTTARYADLARDSIQSAAARITGSIGGNLISDTHADQADR